MAVIGLDIGRYKVKRYDGKQARSFLAVVGEGRERRLRTTYPDSYEVRFGGQHYFVGELAQQESDFCRSMMTDNKAHQDTLLLALVAIHSSGMSDASVVTGLPVGLHDEVNKRAMRDLFMGNRGGVWEIDVDGSRRVIRIADVKVAVEGGGAFWSAPRDGLVRLIDAGSKTINLVTMRDRRYVDRESETLQFGFNTNKSDNPTQLAARISGEAGKRWGARDTVLVAGGRADELAELLRPYFPLTAALPNAAYANAIGFYEAGVRAQ